MSRYDEPDDREDTGGYPASGGRRRAPQIRRRPGEDTGSWTSWRMRPLPARGPGGSARGGRSIFRRHPVVSVLAITTTAVMTGATLVAYAAYRGVVDGIHHVTVTNSELTGSGKRPPELVPGAVNILLVGSDSRAGSHGQYGATTGPNAIIGSRSDTAMVLHISPDHQHATVVSFPRDSLVPQYACKPDGAGHPGQPDNSAAGNTEMLNATYSAGGAPCLWETIEQSTGIRIDHFVEVNFESFKKIVDDLGGIEVCLPQAVRNWRAHLYISKGRHLLKGDQALAFVRLRENIGDGTDLQRIQRQQFFLASALQKIKQTSILTDPQRLYAVVKDVAGSLTTDMTGSDLLALANSLKGVNTSNVQFVTVPWTFDQVNVGRVDWLQPQAGELFTAIKHDTHIPKSVKKAAKSSGKTKTVVTTVAPSKVTVQVLNGTTTAGLAGTTATALSGKGFNVTGSADAPSSNYAKSVIEYSSAAQLPEVNTLKKQVKGAVVKQASGLQSGTLALILGSSFNGLKHKPKATGTSAVVGLTHSFGGISANANICSDQQAFAGPNSPGGG